MPMSDKIKKNRNKGEYVGSFMDKEHTDKILAVEKLFDEYFGDVGRNRSRALRYIIDCFDPNNLGEFPKSQASVS